MIIMVNKMRNRGFTLVELLAVIAIMAVLSIVILPNIVDTFKNSKQDTFLNEIRSVYRVSRQTWTLDPYKLMGDKVYSNKEGCSLEELDLSGRNEFTYYIKINTDGKVKELYATDGTFQFIGGEGLLLTEINNAQISSDLNASERITISCSGVNYGG